MLLLRAALMNRRCGRATHWLPRAQVALAHFRFVQIVHHLVRGLARVRERAVVGSVCDRTPHALGQVLDLQQVARQKPQAQDRWCAPTTNHRVDRIGEDAFVLVDLPDRDRKITASDATVIVICHTDIVTSTRSGASF